MDDINKNPNNPTNVASRFILTDVMTSTSFSITGADYAFYTSCYMELNVGVWGQMYNAEIRVGEPVSSTTYNNGWNAQYNNLYSLKVVIDKCTKGDEAGNYLNLGIAQILSAYNLAMLTDLYGDVPYTEALQPGVIYQPKIDKQQSLYTEVFRLLNDAVTNLGKTTTFPSLGTQDLIYGGNKAKWLKAANGLLARYTMRLSKVSPNYGQVIQYAAASFANNTEELKFTYTGSTSVNPFSRFFQDRNYFGASQSLNDKLVARNDPRKAKFFKPVTTGGAIVFAPNGKPDQRQAYYAYSGLTSATAPTFLMSYHELQFLKAEAYMRQTPVAVASAEAALIEGIKAAFVKVGLTAADATSYYTTSVKALFDANPLKEIMNQKYFSAYEDEGVEAFNDYRRLKGMNETHVILVNTLQFPLRFTYGSSDVTTNPNVRDACGDGSYVYTEKVWWAGGTR
jgi:hypothetical protein